MSTFPDPLSALSTDQFDFKNSPDEVCRTLLRNLAGAEPESNCQCSKEFARAIQLFCTDAIQRGVRPENLAKEVGIEANQSEGDRRSLIKQALLKAYEENFDALNAALKTSTSSMGTYPKVVGIDWSIFSVVETTEEAEFEEPLAEISFKIISPIDGKPETLKIVCNKNHLQDFHWKVKEACNFVQKLATKEN